MTEASTIPMTVQYGVGLVFLIAAVAFIVIGLWFPKLFRPNNPNQEKLSPYECGERPVGSPWIRFNIRFYIIAILFIIFDVEVLFIIPWAVVFRDLYKEMGMLVFYEMLVFIAVLGVGLIYCWVKGYLEWVFQTERR